VSSLHAEGFAELSWYLRSAPPENISQNLVRIFVQDECQYFLRKTVVFDEEQQF
jgi:hypothetical protein